MPLTGTGKKAAAATPTIRLSDLLDQLDSEWTTLRQDSVEIHGDDAGLLAYYHTVLRCMIPLVGDPYTVQHPPGYAASERLPKLCAYLRGLQGAEPGQVKEARERNLAGLRQAWPAYRDLIHPDIPNGKSALDLEVLPFSWDAIESGWNGEDDDPNRTRMLPTFATRASADFHLAALAVLYLNRQCKYALTDLYPHQTTDGRN